MNLQTIIEILEFIRKEIENRKIIEKYEKLIAVVAAVKSKPDKNVTARLAGAKQELLRALGETEPVSWPYQKSQVLHVIDKENITGLRAAAIIDSIFESSQANPEKISIELNNRLEVTRSMVKSGLEAMRFLSAFAVPSLSLSGKTLLTLRFEGKTSIQTISDIERYTRIWTGIINDFALLATNAQCQPLVEMIDKNAMVLNLEGGDKILHAVSFGTRRVIETYSRILRIRKLQLEVQRLSLNNGIGEQLDNEVSITINDISEIVVSELMELNQLHPEADNGELFIKVKKSFRLILDFIEKGGKIECQLSRETDGIDECNKMLLSAYQIVCDIGETIREIDGLRPNQVEAYASDQN